jgi:hypothetical protein
MLLCMSSNAPVPLPKYCTWVTLKTMFTSKAKSRTLQIHYQLATVRKGNVLIANYFQKLTGLVDTLAPIDQPLNEFDLVLFLLAGLSSGYDSFVTSFTTRVDPISLEELYGLLHADQENHLEHNNVLFIQRQSFQRRTRRTLYLH